MQHLDEGTIHAWLDGALTAEEARQAEMHAAGCAACAEAVAEARGLIAASSMILSKLDGVLGGGEARSEAPADAGSSSLHDIAAARAAAELRQVSARRRRLAGPGLRAAAAVLILAGGVAVVQTVTGRDELARVVNEVSLDATATREAETMPEAADGVAQDATAANSEQAPAAPPPPPTVGPAPALPRPVPVVGGVTPARRAAPQAAAGDLAGVLAGVESASGQSNVTPTAAPLAIAEPGVARASEDQANVAESQRAELRRERDFSAAAKAASTAPPPANLSAPAPAAQQLAPPAGARGRIAGSAAAAIGDAFGTAPRCYSLALSPWSPEQATIPAAPATRILLSPDTGTVGPSKGRRLVRPVPGAFAGSYEHAWYTEVSPSTLVLTWATGSEGIVMRLVSSGDELSGMARTFGAGGSPERTSVVRGERVDCGEVR